MPVNLHNERRVLSFLGARRGKLQTKMTSFLDNIVSHGPKPKVLTKDQAARSVVVKNIPPDATAVDVFIHFQQQKNTIKNGGGEIDHVHIPEKGTAVITFESSEGLFVDTFT